MSTTSKNKESNLTMLSNPPSLEEQELKLPPPPPTIFHPIHHKRKELKKPTPREKKELSKTSLIVNIDVGFDNVLFIRGTGPGMSWDKGVPLRNVSSSKWIWDYTGPFAPFEFKILLNDECYENGDNHRFDFGKILNITPCF
mgnify:CR=1 FL=1